MSEVLQVRWNQINRTDWDIAHTNACASYQQDWAYGDVLSHHGAKVWRASVARSDDNTVIALAQITSKPFALVGQFALCTHGPIWLEDISIADKHFVYRTLSKAVPVGWPKLLIFTPDEHEADIKPVKSVKRVMTGEATVRINLEQDVETLRKSMDQKWRNRLTSAEKSGLKFVSGGTKPAQYRWLLDLEETQREKRGYRALPAALTLEWQESKSKCLQAGKNGGISVYRADLGKECAGAMLVLEHGSMATYHIGWTSEEGRKLGAHNLCLWNACLDLKARGFKQFDLGGVNTQSGAGIARFKIGTGGDVFQRGGAFVKA
ncbi:lipid II:glycine glycyltransferase FemX [Hirschia baltica]|uniref:Putative FemAB family protein n=1 Tax=Hirschia baltica (strain ATCC 49814 / DSM 5838 / IFAM 1418) TaxID=582402 RepID=C6XPG6_HIRBI|nr:GNAT family N-acetyltransferase [Hirschia baltica]ACT58452.1 putative FemAB family protein [Hirschia baltica ATCC 49814]